MKLAGQQLMFGEGCLAHLKTLETKRAIIVTGGSSMKKNGIFDEVVGYLHEAGAEVTEFGGVEADPSFRTVWAGAEKMKEFQPDLIIGLGLLRASRADDAGRSPHSKALPEAASEGALLLHPLDLRHCKRSLPLRGHHR